jgi:hypothetical protein
MVCANVVISAKFSIHGIFFSKMISCPILIFDALKSEINGHSWIIPGKPPSEIRHVQKNTGIV